MSVDGSFDAARSEALHEAVRAEIEGGGPSETRFDQLAVEIARYQIAHLPALARLYTRRGIDPSTLRQASELLAVPSELFALTRIACHPASLDTRTFRTSGTSGGAARRGAHPFRTLESYRAAALQWADHLLLGATKHAHAIALLPNAQMLPDSSLSFMVDLICERRGIAIEHVANIDRGVDGSLAEAALLRAREHGAPTLLFGTAFAFVMLLDHFRGRQAALPYGSLAMMTGGFKGRSRVVDEKMLRSELCQLLELDPSNLISEYGMTELSSQLYEPRRIEPDVRAGRFRAPPWLRVSAADPDTLEILSRGKQGLARFVDLCNVDSSVAVQTLDLIEVRADGDIVLLGRPEGAPARGCSLALEDLLLPEGR